MTDSKHEVKAKLDAWLTEEAMANVAEFARVVMQYRQGLVDAGAPDHVATSLTAEFQATVFQAALASGRKPGGL